MAVSIGPRKIRVAYLTNTAAKKQLNMCFPNDPAYDDLETGFAWQVSEEDMARFPGLIDVLNRDLARSGSTIELTELDFRFYARIIPLIEFLEAAEKESL